MVKQLQFKKIRIFRPSLLLGKRDEGRFGEKTAELLLKIFVPLFPFLKNQRPIEGKRVAEAMISSANTDSDERYRVFELDEIFKLTDLH